ncbi:MAG: hypothetical protein KIS63_02485 [Caldilineales bacterium]|nr:hypothetical protein [Caldilineales bacterium]
MARSSRLVLLLSGGGSNLQAILDACADGWLPAQVVAVIGNKAEAFGLERARRAGVPAIHLSPAPFRDLADPRRAYDAALADLAAGFRPDWVVLAGWMRLLTMPFLARFPGPGRQPCTRQARRLPRRPRHRARLPGFPAGRDQRDGRYGASGARRGHGRWPRPGLGACAHPPHRCPGRPGSPRPCRRAPLLRNLAPADRR